MDEQKIAEMSECILEALKRVPVARENLTRFSMISALNVPLAVVMGEAALKKQSQELAREIAERFGKSDLHLLD